jgi:hypothetical protein
MKVFCTLNCITSQSVEPTSNYGGRIGRLEQDKEENKYSSCRMTIKKQRWFIIKSDYYDLNENYVEEL